jgi:hypothetical protein
MRPHVHHHHVDVQAQPRIEINQQPHDAADAARLYGQLSDRAREAIIEAIPLKNALFESKVVIARDHASMQLRGVVMTKLNGHSIRAEHTMDDPGEYGHTARMDMLRALADKLAQRVAERFVVEGMNTCSA